jgi:hypothetical protein
MGATRSEEAPTQLGLLERSSLSHWTSYPEWMALHHRKLTATTKEDKAQ